MRDVKNQTQPNKLWPNDIEDIDQGQISLHATHPPPYDDQLSN